MQLLLFWYSFADICAHFIVNFARIVPDGLLVFFPSYSMMDMCVDFWKNRVFIGSGKVVLII
jgi:Rad3-related DNA helicase